MALIRTYTFHSRVPGPSLLVLGAIHGNELCGTKAIRKVMRNIKTGRLSIARGSVTFAPICNPKAYARGVRFVATDLNRVLARSKNTHTYEKRLANELLDLLAQTDMLLDIHSTTAPTEPFACLDFPTKRNITLTNSLGVSKVVVGWPALYRHSSKDTLAYAHFQKIPAALIECGQHESAHAVRVAYLAICRVLAHQGITPSRKSRATSSRSMYVRLMKFYARPDQATTLAKRYRGFDVVKKGDPLTIRDGAVKDRAPYDGIIIMPKPSAKDGEELLYFGRRVKRPVMVR